MNLSKEIKEAYEYIKSRSKYSPKIGIVLGTGLGELANEIKDAEYYKYMDIGFVSISWTQKFELA